MAKLISENKIQLYVHRINSLSNINNIECKYCLKEKKSQLHLYMIKLMNTVSLSINTKEFGQFQTQKGSCVYTLEAEGVFRYIITCEVYESGV